MTTLRPLVSSALAAGAVLLLCGFTATTLDPGQVEVVTEDVDHFWRAFDEAAARPMAERADVYRREYLELASRGLRNSRS